MTIDTNALLGIVGTVLTLLVTCGLVLSSRNNGKLTKIELHLKELNGKTGLNTSKIAVLEDFKHRSERRDELVAVEARVALERVHPR